MANKILNEMGENNGNVIPYGIKKDALPFFHLESSHIVYRIAGRVKNISYPNSHFLYDCSLRQFRLCGRFRYYFTCFPSYRVSKLL